MLACACQNWEQEASRLIYSHRQDSIFWLERQKNMFKGKRSQEEIFSSFGWWDKGCFLYQMTGDRCDYIESCITSVFGEHALAQQEILEIGSGGGLICEQLAQRKAITVGIDPSPGALAEARRHAQQSG